MTARRHNLTILRELPRPKLKKHAHFNEYMSFLLIFFAFFDCFFFFFSSTIGDVFNSATLLIYEDTCNQSHTNSTA